MNPGRPVVVDASVAVKWVIAEELTDHARALLKDNAYQPLVAPPILLSEVTNAIYQRTRCTSTIAQERITQAEAEDALARVLAVGVDLIGPVELYARSFAFARTHHLKDTYDVLYVVLAQMLGVELWTADRALLDSVGQIASWVRWIGDYAPQ